MMLTPAQLKGQRQCRIHWSSIRRQFQVHEGVQVTYSAPDLGACQGYAALHNLHVINLPELERASAVICSMN